MQVGAHFVRYWEEIESSLKYQSCCTFHCLLKISFQNKNATNGLDAIFQNIDQVKFRKITPPQPSLTPTSENYLEKFNLGKYSEVLRSRAFHYLSVWVGGVRHR